MTIQQLIYFVNIDAEHAREIMRPKYTALAFPTNFLRERDCPRGSGSKYKQNDLLDKYYATPKKNS